VVFEGKQCTLNYSVERRIQGYNKIIRAVLFSIMGERHCLLSLVLVSPLGKGTVTYFTKYRNIQYQKGYKMLASGVLKIRTLLDQYYFYFFFPESWTTLLRLIVHVYLGLSFSHFLSLG